MLKRTSDRDTDTWGCFSGRRFSGEEGVGGVARVRRGTTTLTGGRGRLSREVEAFLEVSNGSWSGCGVGVLSEDRGVLVAV